MKLVSANVVAFGKLRGVNVSFDRGLNVFRQINAYGKTTLCNFIRAMLYGFKYNRVGGVTDASHFQPWGGNERFGGSLTVEHNGEIFRIERFFGTTQKQETLRVFNEKTGREVNWQAQPGEFLLGLTVDSYDRSTYFPQEAVTIVSNDNLESHLANLVQNGTENYDKIQEKLRNYKKNLRYEKGIGGQIAKLEEQKHILERQLCEVKQNKRRSAEIDLRLEQIERESVSLELRRQNIENSASDLRRKIAQAQPAAEVINARVQLAELQDRLAKVPSDFEADFTRCDNLARQISMLPATAHKSDTPRRRTWLYGVAGALGLTGILLIVLGILQIVSVTVGVAVGCVLAALGVACLFGVGKSANRRDADRDPSVASRNQLLDEYFSVAHKYVFADNDIEKTNRALWEAHSRYLSDLHTMETLKTFADKPQQDIAPMENQLRTFSEEIKEISEQKNALFTERGQLSEERRRLDVNSVEIEDKILNIEEQQRRAEYSYKVADIVTDLLARAKDNLSSAYLPRLCARTAQLLREISANDLEVTLDRNFVIALRERGQTKPMSEFSRGVREITLLCFRVALSELLYDNEIPILIVDDAFVNFDENNFMRATALLKKLSERTQIIYFTCHSRTGNFAR